MCGIAGYVIRKGVDARASAAKIREMTSVLNHRGPDDEGYFVTDSVALGSKRLKIIDLSPAARMPISNESGTVWIVFNGEIYNYQDIREKLIQKGHRFKSCSDTEVIVHLYEEYGVDCLNLLDGMFAIAIWDSERDTLLLARDRFGEKPLYYCVDDEGSIVFASEPKSILLYSSFKSHLDWGALRSYFKLGYIIAPRTPYANIFKLPPSSYVIYDQRSGTLKSGEYWSFPDQVSVDLHKTEDEIIDELEEMVFESVRAKMRSDVPLGAFLSGGIDSSLVVAGLCKARGTDIATFSIGTKSFSSHNENEFARAVASEMRISQHHELDISIGDVLQSVRAMFELCDEPIADGALLANYLLTRFAKDNGFTVMLSGDGGDELFLGYPIFQWLEYLRTFYALPRPIRGGISKSFDVAASVARLSRFQKASLALLEPNLARCIYYLTGYGAWSDPELSLLMLEQGNDETTSRYEEHLRNPLDIVAAQQAILVATYLPDNNCARMDRASMANSVEVRSPFLDPGLALFAASIPANLKIKGGVSKYVLRRLLSRYIRNDSIINRPKRGFSPIPLDIWLRGEMKFLVDQYLSYDRLREQGFFDAQYVQRIVSEHMKGGEFNHAWKLWILIVFQMWFEKWVH